MFKHQAVPQNPLQVKASLSHNRKMHFTKKPRAWVVTQHRTCLACRRLQPSAHALRQSHPDCEHTPLVGHWPHCLCGCCWLDCSRTLDNFMACIFSLGLNNHFFFLHDKKHAFPENRPQTQEEKKYLLSAAVMETVSETASSIWKVPLKLPSIMEMNLLVGIPVVCLWD